MTINDTPESRLTQLIFLRGHLRLQAKGLRHRQVSGTELLKRAGKYLGKTYKRGRYQEAINDINAVLAKELP